MTRNIDELDPLYRDVFKDPKNGTPDNITQSGCLELAGLGKEAWNAWREKFPVHEGDKFGEYINFVDFSGYEFQKWDLDFSGFKFGDRANFKDAKFTKSVTFREAKFGYHTNFQNAQFNDDTNFSFTKFGDMVNFQSVLFGRRAYANFFGAQFGKYLLFGASSFQNHVSFAGAQFDERAIFDLVRFDKNAYFTASKWESISFDDLPDDYYDLDEAKKWAESRGLSPEAFQSISFKGAKFNQTVNFSGRSFEGPTSFASLDEPTLFSVYDENNNIVDKTFPAGERVIFKQAPLFHNCKFHQDISFDQAEFPKPTGSDKAVRAYRTLKLAFSQQQATREEQRFFKLEMAEEAKRARGDERWLFATYKILGDYGFDYLRPVLFLLASVLIFAVIYGFMGATPCFSLRDTCGINFQFLEFSLIQAIPVPGLDKWSDSLRHCLFPVELGGTAIVTTVIVMQKTISLLFLFLMGLALRNLFKFK